MAYIIDRYDKYNEWDRIHSVYKFEINEQWYAVKEVILFWGQPQLPVSIEEEKNPETYSLYQTKEEAMEFVRRIRELNAR